MFNFKSHFFFSLKIEVLTDLSFFSEAFHEIAQMFYGKHMPSLIPAGSRVSIKVKVNLLIWFKAISLPFKDYFPEIQRLLPQRCVYKSPALQTSLPSLAITSSGFHLSGMEGCYGGGSVVLEYICKIKFSVIVIMVSVDTSYQPLPLRFLGRILKFLVNVLRTVSPQFIVWMILTYVLYTEVLNMFLKFLLISVRRHSSILSALFWLWEIVLPGLLNLHL